METSKDQLIAYLDARAFALQQELDRTKQFLYRTYSRQDIDPETVDLMLTKFNTEE